MTESSHAGCHISRYHDVPSEIVGMDLDERVSAFRWSQCRASQPAASRAASIRYVDQPECRETFADSINSVFFDGQTMRIEFGITRMDEMKQGAAARPGAAIRPAGWCCRSMPRSN